MESSEVGGILEARSTLIRFENTDVGPMLLNVAMISYIRKGATEKQSIVVFNNGGSAKIYEPFDEVCRVFQYDYYADIAKAAKRVTYTGHEASGSESDVSPDTYPHASIHPPAHPH